MWAPAAHTQDLLVITTYTTCKIHVIMMHQLILKMYVLITTIYFFIVTGKSIVLTRTTVI